MRRYSQKWTIVKLLEPLTEGVVYNWRDWPLHLTLADIFAVKDIDRVILSLEVLARSSRSFDVGVGASEFWGPHRLRVARIEPDQKLLALHQMILNALSELGAVFSNPEHIGKGYTPHVAVKAGLPQDHGIIKMDNFTLIDMFPSGDHNQRRVHKNFRLLAGKG